MTPFKPALAATLLAAIAIAPVPAMADNRSPGLEAMVLSFLGLDRDDADEVKVTLRKKRHSDGSDDDRSGRSGSGDDRNDDDGDDDDGSPDDSDSRSSHDRDDSSDDGDSRSSDDRNSGHGSHSSSDDSSGSSDGDDD